MYIAVLTGSFFKGCTQSIPHVLSLLPLKETTVGDSVSNINKQIDSYILFFLKSTPLELQAQALAGRLENSGIRSLCWFYFLDFLEGKKNNLKSWIDKIRKERKEYEEVL